MRFFGTSGIRAVYNNNLLVLAFKVGMVVGRGYKNVVIATDTRTSGDAMKSAVVAGLLAVGAQCQDAGIAPTPTLAFITREFDAGVMITASHNPPEYNGIKLLNPDGSSFTSSQQAQMEEEILSENYSAAPWDEIKKSGLYHNAVENHIDRIAADFPSGLGLKVVVDAGCGAASEVTPQLLTRLGCEVITLNCHHSGFFPRPAEPTEANLQDLCQAVKESGAALGIAHDGDADRMMAVDDRGRFVPGDILLPIFAHAVSAADVVTTLDASMAIDEMGYNVRRTPIGDTWVSEELRNGGDFGGETSGSWVFPAISLCPDGIYAAAQATAIAGKQKISELVDEIPKYPLLRGSIPGECSSISDLEVALKGMKPKEVSNIDGVKLSFDDGWLLVRPSGTEPKVRLTAEAKSSERAQQLYDDALKIIEEKMNTGENVN
jgi:phosphoglucosamine mutase